jgi:NAD(P) transhydrogenase subunit alpha
VHPAFAKAEAEVEAAPAVVAEKVAKPKAAPKVKAPAVKAEAEKPVAKTTRKAPAKAAKTSADGGEA